MIEIERGEAHRRTRKAALLGGVFLAAFGLAAPALAQTTVRTTDASGVTVGELEVIATKREQRLQDVPEAVVLVTGQEIASTGPINTTQDVLNMAPSTRYTNLADPLNSEISIRGSGTERATGAESSVGLYFDGVYVGLGANQLGGRNLAPIDSFDLDRLEVYEGPQGALYGRDSEFGIVNAIPQQPTFSNSGSVDDAYNFQTQQNILSAIANFKVNDNLAVRIGAEDFTQQSGFEYNPDTNTYYDQTKGYMVRGRIRYQSGRLDMNLLAEHQDLQVPQFWSADEIPAVNKTTGYPGTAILPFGFSQNPRVLPHNGLDYAWEGVSNVILSIKYDTDWGTLSSTTSWRTLDTIDEEDDDFIDVAQETSFQQQCQTLKVALSSCGAYPFIEADDVGHATTWYQDLHFAGAPVWNNRLTWLAGVEFLNQPNHGFGTGTSNPCPVTATIKLPTGASVVIPTGLKVGDGVCVGAPNGVIQQVSLLPGSVFPAVTQPAGEYGSYSGNYFSWAPYASATFDFGHGFKLDGAIRYSNDHKDSFTPAPLQLYTSTPYNFLTTGQPVGPESYVFNKSVVTYALTLSWKLPFMPWNDMLYVKTGSGYRAGGFNLGKSEPMLAHCTSATDESGCLTGVISPPLYYAPVTPDYTDEYTTSYEAGFKGDVTSHVYFALDGYYSVTTNALAAVGDGCGTKLIAADALGSCIVGNTNYTVNAGTVRGWGVEAQIDTAWALAGGKLALNLTGSRQYSWYASEPNIVGLPIVGTQVAENPGWVASALINYSHPITDKLTGFFNLVYHGQWGGIQDPETVAGVFAPLANYNLINLKTGLTYDRLQVALIVSNLTNDIYYLSTSDTAGVNTVTGSKVVVAGQQRFSLPRSFGIEASYKW